MSEKSVSPSVLRDTCAVRFLHAAEEPEALRAVQRQEDRQRPATGAGQEASIGTAASSTKKPAASEEGNGTGNQEHQQPEASQQCSKGPVSGEASGGDDQAKNLTRGYDIS